MEQARNDPSQVRGWGVDADPENDPTYPMKKRNNGEHAGYAWERPPQQPIDVEVLHSNERPNLTAVFGTSTPPTGPPTRSCSTRPTPAPTGTSPTGSPAARAGSTRSSTPS